MMNARIKYIAVIGTNAVVNKRMMNRILTREALIPVASAMPPSTPANLLFVLERVSFMSSTILFL